ICVGGMWRCNTEKPEPKGPSAIIQLRRDVALTLMNVAADIRSGNIATAAAELEATAALLDYRYFHKLKGPPPPKPGYAPSALGSSSPQSAVLQMLPEELEETKIGYIIKKSPRDLLNDKIKISIENQQNNMHESFTNKENYYATAKVTQFENFLASENNMKKVQGVTGIPQSNTLQKNSLKEEVKHSENHLQSEDMSMKQYMDYTGSSKLPHMQDLNILPGEAELDDLGDEPLPAISSQVRYLSGNAII
ncbi:hypothetical protein SK128_017566, partial [Halocaridina rubra]